MLFIKRKCWTNREFRRFSYRACTWPFANFTVGVVVLEYGQLHRNAVDGL